MKQFDRTLQLLGLVILVGINACSTTSQLSVESNPEGADVTVIDGSKVPKKVGVTPYVLKQENTPQLFQNSLQINVSKEGYKTQPVFIPETSMSSKGQLVVQLQKEDSSLINSTAQGVAEAQRLVFAKKYAEAERILQDYLIKSPNVAVLHSLLGNVFYLEKNTSRALESYQKAQFLEPGNVAVQNMIQKLRGIQAPNAGGQ